MNALVILVSSLLFVMSLAMFVWTRKQLKEFQLNLQAKIRNKEVSSELVALNAGSIGLGERFIKLEKQLQQYSIR